MGNCYSTDHIAEDHTDMICNVEEPQQNYHLGTVSNRLQGEGGLKLVLLDPDLALCSVIFQPNQTPQVQHTNII